MNKFLKNLVICSMMAFSSASLTTGCTNSGQHVSQYRDLNVRINYSSTFQLEPGVRYPEAVYFSLRDLSGTGLDQIFNRQMTERLMQYPNVYITHDPREADIVVYATISATDNRSSHSTTGVIAGAATGAIAGSVIASSRHGSRYYHHHHHTHASDALPLILGLVGAGIGYAIDDSLSINTLYINTDIEVHQKNSEGTFNKYTTSVQASGQQLNMNKRQASEEILGRISEGIAQLIKH